MTTDPNQNSNNSEEKPYIVDEPGFEYQPHDEDDIKEKFAMKRPEQSILDESAADAIQQQNAELMAQVGYDLRVIERMQAEFNKNDDTRASKSFALVIQANAIDLMTSRGQMRQCLQLVWQLLRYKPVDIEQYPTRKALWSKIMNGCDIIVESALQMSVTGAKFCSFLVRIYDSLNYFRNTQKKHPNMDLSLSLAHFQTDMNDFLKFSEDYIVAIKVLRKNSLQSMKELMGEMQGNEHIRDAFDGMAVVQDELKKARDDLDLAERTLGMELLKLKLEIASVKGDQVYAKLAVDHANGHVKEYKRRMKDARQEAEKYQRYACHSSNSYQQSYTHTRSSWWGFSSTTYRYTKTVYTGNKNRYQRQCDQMNRVANSNQRGVKINQSDLRQAERSAKSTTEKLRALESNYNMKSEQTKKHLAHKRELVAEKTKKYKEVSATIEKSRRKSGMYTKEGMADFFSITLSLSTKTFGAIENADVVGVNLQTFYQLMKRKCMSRLSIEHYFPIITLPLNFVEALAEEEYILVEDLQCDDNEEYEDEILPIILEANNNKKISKKVKKVLKQTCVGEGKTWREMEKQMRVANKSELLGQSQVLCMFFDRTFCTMRDATKMLAFETFEDANVSAKAIAAVRKPLPIMMSEPTFEDDDEDEDEDEDEVKKPAVDDEPADDESSSKESAFLALLKEWGMEQYVDGFDDEGFNNLSDLDGLEEPDLKNVIKKKSHRKKFAKKLKVFLKAKKIKKTPPKKKGSKKGKGKKADPDSGGESSNSSSSSSDDDDDEDDDDDTNPRKYANKIKKVKKRKKNVKGKKAEPDSGSESEPESGSESEHESDSSSSDSPSPKVKGKTVDIVKTKLLFKSLKNGQMTCFGSDFVDVKFEFVGDPSVLKKVRKIIHKGKKRNVDVYICVKEKHVQIGKRKKKRVVIQYTVLGAEYDT